MNKLMIVFGDLTGWGQRRTLSHTSTIDQPVEFNASHTFAKVDVGPATLTGPIVHAAVDDNGSITVVYLGRRVPVWVDSPMPKDFGWSEDDFPPGVTNRKTETDVLLVTFDADGKATGWSRTSWLTIVPRPMERLELLIDDTSVRQLRIRALESGVDTTEPETNAHWLIATPEEGERLTSAELEAAGWSPEPWVESRQETWMSLRKLSNAIETHTEPLMNTPIVTHVTIHNLLEIDETSLPLIPRDVRDGLERALEGLPDD